jgi:pimeloyl-ACP methyl ester carboxylesterase
MKMQATDGQTQRILVNNPVLASELVTRNLGAISIPTLVVWGGDDLAEPLADGRDYAAKIPRAKLVIVKDCGHFPSLEKPDDLLLPWKRCSAELRAAFISVLRHSVDKIQVVRVPSGFIIAPPFLFSFFA